MRYDQIILDAVEQSKRVRSSPETISDDHLLTLKQVQENWIKDPKISLPLFCKSKSPPKDDGTVAALSAEQVGDILRRDAPLLEGFDFENLMVAGGCISNILQDTRARIHGSDVDFFFYGADMSIEKAVAILNRSLSHFICKLEEQIQANERSGSLPLAKTAIRYSLQRGPNTVSFIADDIEYQFVLRIYKNKAEILEGFDLSSGSVGYDGQEVYFTPLAKISHEARINIADPTRRSTTYEQRLCKYLERHFSIVMPNLDLKAVKKVWARKSGKTIAVDILNHQLISVAKSTESNIMYHSRFIFNDSHDLFVAKMTPEDVEEYCELTGTSLYMRGRFNIYNAVRKDPRRMFAVDCTSFPKDDNEVSAQLDRFLSGALDRNHIHAVRNIFSQDLTNNMVAEGKFNFKKWSSYINEPTAQIVEFFQKFMDQPLMLEKKLYDYVAEMCSFKCMQVVELLDTASGLNWITANPGTQLTSSINPIIEDPKKWYGKFYTPTPQMKE